MSAGRTEKILAEVQSVMEQVSGQEIEASAADANFYDLGMDSLLLTQAAQALSKRFGVKLKLRDLAENLQSCQLVASFLADKLPPTEFASDGGAAKAAPNAPSAPAPAAVASAPATRVSAMTSNDDSSMPRVLLTTTLAASGVRRAASAGVDEILRQQLALMSRQLELLSGGATALAHAVQPAQPVAEVPSTAAATQPTDTPTASTAAASTPSEADSPPSQKPHRHGPQLVIDKGTAPSGLTPSQEKHIQRLIERYTAKTRQSKEFTTRNRPQVADPRTAAGFRPKLKEMVYPIVARRSSGCRIWDLDGNEYIDLLSGYGSNFFGFGAPFIREAVARQLEEGMEIGPQTWLAEEVATLFREFVPADRVAFCNTGSEAVLATMRMARTATGRDLIVMFNHAYHGMFDEVVVRPTKKRSMPAAPGIPTSAVDNILVLPWAQPEALDYIREHGDEIAAVLVEPVQSREPETQPAEFLKELRRLTEQTGSALIFDEVVCGFRVAPGGAQEHFGIQADLASYGKVVGGGMSIGIVAGKSAFMDTLDGGQWQYGDASIPEVGVTYFAGTFVRHPVVMAAARASLLFMKEQGPDLQRRVNTATERFADELNAFLRAQSAPLEVRRFSSVLKFAHTAEVPYSEIVFAHLRERGVHVWDGRPSFFTMTHGPEEAAFVIKAFKDAVAEMQEGGFYPQPTVQVRSDAPPVEGARLGRDQQGNPTWFVPDPTNPSRYVPLARA